MVNLLSILTLLVAYFPGFPCHLYFTQDRLDLTILGPSTDLLKLYLVSSDTRDFECHVSHRHESTQNLFRAMKREIQNSNIDLFVVYVSFNWESLKTGKAYSLKVTCSQNMNASAQDTNLQASVEIDLKTSLHLEAPCMPCFSGAPSRLLLAEDFSGVAATLRQVSIDSDCQYEYELINIDLDSYNARKIDVHTSPPDFKIVSPIDFEKYDEYSFLVQCHVTPGEPSMPTYTERHNFSIINERQHFNTSPRGKPIFLRIPTPKTVVSIPIDASSSHKVTAISSVAALFARVDVRLEGGASHCKYSVVPSGAAGLAFNVTPRSGIVYVANVTALRSLSELPQPLSFKIHREDEFGIKVMKSSFTIIVINITKSLKHDPKKMNCTSTCSSHDLRNECVKTCGFGTSEKLCRWRSSFSDQPSSFETCTPDVGYCPDGICDELESLHPQICPQDCTYNVTGAETNQETLQGIAGSTSNKTCICETSGYDQATQDLHLSSCHCSYIYQDPNLELDDKYSIDREVPRTVGSQIQTIGFHCDQHCYFILAGTLAGTAIVILLLVLRAWRLRRIKANTVKRIKNLAAGIPLNNMISSEIYSGDREDTTSSGHIGGNSQIPNILNLGPAFPIDAKWEFPRRDLILGETLGEGEFGQVRRARALNINGTPGYTTVAVKMLKMCASSAELRDLWSEYTLLKEVSHRNVITLLGACTKDGPLLVIEEFCQYGSLRSYLQSLRFPHGAGGEYADETRQLIRTPSTTESGRGSITSSTSEYSGITCNELLGFAWQIAKGMEYLANMKVVHRDLATRNILLASGKVIKISDFGLSRDVYVEETYLKKTKGRIPIKWMAPESLFENVYTSKSDVWSFGIVLWEIVTLGMTPYPNITPANLLKILQNDYRMSKPSGCSDELYDVMIKCWQTCPVSRPTFTSIVELFEDMMIKNIDYLDVSGITDIKNEVSQSHPIASERPTTGGEAQPAHDDDGYGSIIHLPMEHDAYVKSLSQSRTIQTISDRFDPTYLDAINQDDEQSEIDISSGAEHQERDTLLKPRELETPCRLESV